MATKKNAVDSARKAKRPAKLKTKALVSVRPLNNVYQV
jgi:hypothetical protein